ncbi:UbiD family decarboxylase [Devosia sp. 1566]|uniref:UbiD family decarboxylase n=1 Tax=Devosia sp. 1566 TaxID=2499144 RepID=UPI000FD8FEF5|nr:UbiD family decarboxylase [Devosia sp. 1566]
MSLFDRISSMKRNEAPSLRSWLADLQDHEILTLDQPTDIDYLPTALVLELERQGRDPVVVIDNPDGFTMPVVSNLFASRERIARFCGVEPGKFHERWAQAAEKTIAPRLVESGPVHDHVIQGDELDIGALPISRHFEKDAGRYIGSGILICKDPDTGVRNLSYQRLQLKGPNRLGASLHSRGHIWEHLSRCAARGKNLEVAIVIGVHPAINLAAAAKVAMEVDELDIAGGLLGQPVDLVKCKTIEVEVPAWAEMVIEGEILAGVEEEEGPFGEYTGYSTYRSTKNVFVAKAITHRERPIFHDIIPGFSAEHLLLGRSSKEAHVVMRLREMVPNLKAVNWPKSGTHFHAYMSLKKSAEGQPNHAMMLLMGLDPYIKLVVAVDEDVDVFNQDEVMWALATRFQADTDMFCVPNALCNQLDPSSRNGTSAKLALDATAPMNWDVERAVLPESAQKWARETLTSIR